MVVPWISGAKKEQGGVPSGQRTSKVPNAKKPKIRPPRGLRDTIAFPVRSLPNYSGPYHVGTMEIEVAVREPRTFSHIKRHGEHPLQLKTVLFTMYYPASPPDSDTKVSRQLWLGRPRLRMAQGYSHFAKLGNLGMPMFIPTIFTKLPAWRNAPLSDRLPPNSKPSAGPETHKDDPPPKFPLMIFSHGLGGTDTCYSSVCGEFASYGFVVVALEHRDGSGPRTYVNQPFNQEIKLDENLDYEKNPHQNLKKKRKEGLKTKYDIVDYIFPEDNPWDTAPNNEKGVDHELRSAQIDLRLAEIEEAYEILRTINSGKGADVATKNLRRKNYMASSSRGLDGVDWTQWKDRVQMNNAVAAGHSFGAATVTDILRHRKRFEWVAQGIIYDIWGEGTRPPSEMDDRIQSPVLAINSEAFTYWSKNYKLVESLIDEASPYPSWLMTVRGTVHVNQSDFSLLYPHVCSAALKMTANPERAIDVNVNASLEFLKMVMPGLPDRMIEAFPQEGILTEEEAPLELIPTAEKHMPDEKWIAGRLSIPHEFWWRITPGFARKMAKARVRQEGGTLGEEVWLHKRPDDETIKEFTLKVRREAGAECGGCGKESCSSCQPQKASAKNDDWTGENADGSKEGTYEPQSVPENKDK
ncbi:hypothetical protein AAFC00_003827 [Neodothiora populina]|uniref:1-alkyl-2-acetylglycerophosphocholine esterase n=1 Tax=Neodothiora populina TaxID=2781224 RepID=A0ABR3PFR4_9PEZI